MEPLPESFEPENIFEPNYNRRFGGLSRLYGSGGSQNIVRAHVVVVGIGGVGSWCAEALARSGVGQLTLIDLDHIAESNVNRQIHALENSFGQSKVQAMCQRIALINPACQVQCVEEFVDARNWPAVAGLSAYRPSPSLAVVDACDQVKAKLSMAAWALETGTNFITVGAAGGKRHAHAVDIADLAKTTHDPLLAQLRYRLRKEKKAPRQGKIGLTCVFSQEPVVQPHRLAPSTNANAATPQNPKDGTLNCHGYGSVVSVTATFGMCAAGWVLEKIANGTSDTRST